jgi:cyclic-di-AMP phosphodiesterase PgpH
MKKALIVTGNRPTFREILSSLLLVAVSGALILKMFSFANIEKLAAGDVARSDIYATLDLNIPDTVTTEARRLAAREQAPNVYIYDPRAHEKVTFILDQLFQKLEGYQELRDSLISVNGKTQKTETEKQIEVLNKQYQDELSSLVPPAIFLALKDSKNLENLKPLLTELMDRLYTREFAEDHNNLKLINGEAVLADSGKDQQYLTKGFPPVVDRAGLKKFVYSFLRNREVVHDDELSIIFALVNHIVIPNYIFDKKMTEASREEAADSVEPSYLRKKTGEIIVRKGERISPVAARFINEQNERLLANISSRRIVSTLLLLILTVFFLYRLSVVFQKRYVRDEVPVFLLLVWCALAGIVLIKLSIFVLGAVERSVSLSVLFKGELLFYAVPYAFPASLAALLAGGIPALIVTLCVAIILLLLTAGNIPLTLFLIFSSLSSIYILRKQSGQSAVLFSGFWLGLSHFVFLIILYLHYSGNPSLEWYGAALVIALAGGFFVSAAVTISLPTFESAFRITTDIRLLELANMNNRLLVDLSMKAAGTYQHSILVANLVEAAAKAIGANSLLARVGTYYHDIGKMEKPGYFIENQRPGDENRHNRLTPKMSSIILTNHVKDGIKLAQEAKLPEQIIRFIKEHHGTKLMAFFYNKALSLQEENGEAVEESEYQYPGPKPTMKETAILMIGDAVEAASRTLKAPISAGKLQNLVNRIIKDLIDDNQFSDCDLTFKELDLIAASFLRSIAASFHTRIDYPGFDFNEENAELEGHDRSDKDSESSGDGNGGKDV